MWELVVYPHTAWSPPSGPPRRDADGRSRAPSSPNPPEGSRASSCPRPCRFVFASCSVGHEAYPAYRPFLEVANRSDVTERVTTRVGLAAWVSICVCESRKEAENGTLKKTHRERRCVAWVVALLVVMSSSRSVQNR